MSRPVRRRGGRSWVLASLLGAAAAALLTGCESPPQVVQIDPARGQANVRSSQPVDIQFDRPMDRASVESHFRIVPAVQGSLRWVSDEELAFDHRPFNPSSQYQVALEPGYRDARGTVNTLRHSWTFVTEAAPVLADSSPGQGDRDVDPASYVTLTFSRQMDLGSVAGAATLSPATSFTVRADPTDPRRVVLVPRSMLDPGKRYSVAISADARDVDGNRLESGGVLLFTTGALRSLHHWVGFIAEPTAGGPSAGVWVVNENRVPRQLVSGPVTAFTWSPSGSRLLVRGEDGAWTDRPLAGPGISLPIHAGWADYLAPGDGYAFLDGGTLQILRPDGRSLVVATGVGDVATSPDGGTLAFVVTGTGAAGHGSEIDAYDVDLHARYRLQAEPAAVDGLAWSPDGLGLAYRVDPGDPQHRLLRVRSLRDGSVTTVATGPLSPPLWQADRQHLFATAPVATGTGTVTKVFRFAISGPAASPRAADGLPPDAGVDVSSLSPSADGHQLAVISEATGLPAVWLMNADGTGLTQLTSYDPEEFPYSCRAVAWTPT